MTARVFSIICYGIAGFFVYMVAMLGFAIVPSTAIKAGIMFGFSIPAIIALGVGFALDGFRHMLRDTGIVLLSSAGFMTYIILTFACLMATDEFKKMMKPGTMSFFSDYAVGFGFLAIVSVAGLIAFRMGSKKPKLPEPTAAIATPPPLQNPRR